MSLAAGQIVDTDDLPGARMVYKGNRNSTRAHANNTTEVGVLRIDSMALKGGHVYQVIASNLRFSFDTTSTGHFVTKLRYTNSGSASSASSEYGRSEFSNGGVSTYNDNTASIIALIEPASDETGSVYLGLARTSGVGIATLQADPGAINILVIDLGDAVGDSGIDL